MSNLSNQNSSKMNENVIHPNNIECLKHCTNYNLLIKLHQTNYKDYSFFSKINHAQKNDVFLINNYSSSEIIQTIFKNSINSNQSLVIPYNYESLFSKSSIDKSIKDKIIHYPLESEKISKNFIDFSKNIGNHLDNEGLNLLIKFDLNSDNKSIILDKNILYNLLSFKISGKIHKTDLLLDKDVLFLIDIKKIIKSIQIKLEYLQTIIKQPYNMKYFFIPLLEYQNIGIIISPNSQFTPFNINEMKTNFNSIVKQKFILKSIIISLNISSLFKNIIINTYNPFIKGIENNKEKLSDYTNDETTSSSSNNSPNLSYEKVYENLNMPLDNNFCLFNNYTNINNNLNNKNNINKNYINNNLNQSYKNKLKTHYLKSNNNKKKQFNNYNCNNDIYKNRNYYQKYFDINTIIINSNDIFSKTLFNRYQDKSNSTCNLKILIEFLKIHIKKPLSEITIFDFFSYFSFLSSFSLKIPLFNKDGTIIKTTLTPTLHELKLYIKNPKYIKKIEKKLQLNKNISEKKTSSPLSLNDKDNNIYKEIEGFEISILENGTILRISYNENKPYYLTESLFENLEKLMNLFKCFKKINIAKNILIDKSFISIGWNSINASNIFSSSFIFYYLFNGNLLGVLSDIKENEKYFWLNSIEEIQNKRKKVDYNYLIEENYCKVYDFINNSNKK